MEKNKKKEKNQLCSSSRASITKDHSLGRTENNGNPFSRCSGGCKSQIKVPGGLVSFTASLLGYEWLPSCFCLHGLSLACVWRREGERASSGVSLLLRTLTYLIRVPPLWSHWTLITSSEALSPHAATRGFKGFTINFEGEGINIQSTTFWDTPPAPTAPKFCVLLPRKIYSRSIVI